MPLDDFTTPPRVGGARAGLSNLRRLLVGPNAPPEHPIHITIGGDASASARPKET